MIVLVVVSVLGLELGDSCLLLIDELGVDVLFADVLGSGVGVERLERLGDETDGRRGVADVSIRPLSS